MTVCQHVTRAICCLVLFLDFKRHKEDHKIDVYKLVFFGHVLLPVPVSDARLVPGAA